MGIKTKWGTWTTECDADKLMGEVVAQDARGIMVPQGQVRKALEDAGLDPKLCRDIATPKALRRAVQKLRQTKIVGEVEDTEDRLVFQFSRATKQTVANGSLPWATIDGEGLSYEGEGRVVLDKHTGDLDGDNKEMVQQVAQMLDEALATRKTQDVTSIAHKIFKQHADLFPIKAAGGAYFVPARHLGLVDAVEKFLAGVGVKLARYPIAKGYVTGDTTVRDAIDSGITAMVEDHLASIDRFSPATRDSTMDAEIEGIKLTRFKIECYIEYLTEDVVERLRKQAALADAKWQAKVEAILDERGDSVDGERSGGASEGEDHAATPGPASPAGHDTEPALAVGDQ